MTPSTPRLMLLATSMVFIACTDKSVQISQGGAPVEVRGQDPNAGGGGGSGSGGGGGGSGSGSGGSYDTIEGYLSSYLAEPGCYFEWSVSGFAESCSSCDYRFDVDMDSLGGSCGDSYRSGTLEVAYGAMYFDGQYLGTAYVSGNSILVQSMGYVYYYDYYSAAYSGSFYMY